MDDLLKQLNELINQRSEIDRAIIKLRAELDAARTELARLEAEKFVTPKKGTKNETAAA